MGLKFPGTFRTQDDKVVCFFSLLKPNHVMLWLKPLPLKNSLSFLPEHLAASLVKTCSAAMLCCRSHFAAQVILCVFNTGMCNTLKNIKS